MLTVWKYAIPIDDRFTLDMPIGALILTVQAQQDKPQLWALVDPDAEIESRTFRLAGTGHPIKEESLRLLYLGTFQAHDGALVLHLFEVMF